MTYMDIYAYFNNTHNIIILCAFKCKLFNLVFTLVEISQNVTSPFWTTCDWLSFATRFGNIATTRSNFNYFAHSHNYDATIIKFHPIGWIDFTFIFIH